MATLKPTDIAREAVPFETEQKFWQVIGQLFAAHAALLAKLDADAGVTDTNYAATCTPTDSIST